MSRARLERRTLPRATSPMSRASPVSRLSLAGAVPMTALIGNWRASNAETDHRAASPKPLQAASIRAGSHVDGRHVNGGYVNGSRFSVDGVVDGGGLLVPAIYAWDPQIRVVYDRPVSRWM